MVSRIGFMAAHERFLGRVGAPLTIVSEHYAEATLSSPRCRSIAFGRCIRPYKATTTGSEEKVQGQAVVLRAVY